jgi:chromosomal replication initiator protein
VGKTHLLEGIWKAARRSPRRHTAVYLSAEQFATDFLQALRGSGLPSFRSKYRGVDLLIIDDLHFLCGKKCTQVELLYTIDTLMREGRQLVFAGDRPPAEMCDLGPELTARLACGMVCRVDSPEFAVRLGLVRQFASRFALDVPEDVCRFVAERFSQHAREISGALCRLKATSDVTGQPVTLAFAQEALDDLLRQANRPIRLTDIEQAVCDAFGLEPKTLQSGRRAKNISHPRMLAMWLARKHTRAALTEIGYYFGGRSHSTVASAKKQVDRWLSCGEALDVADHTLPVDEAIRQVERCLRAV